MKKLVIVYYHSSLGKRAFQFQKYGRTLILEPRTLHQIDDIEQGLFWEPLLWGSTGRIKEELPVRRQGHLAFSALSGLGDLGHPPSPFLVSASLWMRRWAGTDLGPQPALRADRIGSLRNSGTCHLCTKYPPAISTLLACYL